MSEATGVTNFHGAISRFFWPKGTLVVEVDDPEVTVTLDGGAILITGRAKEIRLKPGEHTLHATKDGKAVQQESITVSSNTLQVVRISKQAAPVTQADKLLIACTGFNNHRGLNSSPIPGKPYWLDSEAMAGGDREPGWAGPWSTLSSPRFSFQKKLVYEGDGALFICKEGADRQLAEAQRGQFQVEMFIQVPDRGGTGCYLKNGSGAFRDGPVWSVGKGSFRVMDGHNNWRQTDLTYELGKWHKVSLRVDVTHRHWQFFVDDKKFENPRGPLLFRSNEASLDTIRLQCENETGIYIDALRFLRLPDIAGKD